MILFVLNFQKEQNPQGPLRCLSHALDPFGFGAWQLWYLSLGYDSVDFENENWFWFMLGH